MTRRKRWTILDVDEQVISFVKVNQKNNRITTGLSLEKIIKSTNKFKEFRKSQKEQEG